MEESENQISKTRIQLENALKEIHTHYEKSSLSWLKSIKVVLLEIPLASIAWAMFFPIPYTNIPLSLSSILIHILIATTLLVVPVNLIVGAYQQYRIKSLAKHKNIFTYIDKLNTLEKEYFERYLGAQLQLIRKPKKSQILSLSISFPEYLVYGPRDVSFCDKSGTLCIDFTQDFLGVQGRLLVVKKNIDDIDSTVNEVRLVYTEHKWEIFINTLFADSNAFAETYTFSLLKRYAEMYSLSGFVHILFKKIQKNKWTLFVIIEDYLPVPFDGYKYFNDFIDKAIGVIKILLEAS
ncbi:MAG: hypothetical protein ACP6IS_06100 [Candidatus Asgardarchaeia archaeon]